MAGNSALSPVQAAIFALLTAEPSLQTALGGAGRVFDHVPATTNFPYLVISELAERPDDTLGTKGRMLTLTLDAFSQAEGYKELEAIAEATIALIDNDDFEATIDVAGWTLISSIYANGNLTREIDGLTRHAELSFEIGVSNP